MLKAPRGKPSSSANLQLSSIEGPSSKSNRMNVVKDNVIGRYRSGMYNEQTPQPMGGAATKKLNQDSTMNLDAEGVSQFTYPNEEGHFIAHGNANNRQYDEQMEFLIG